MLYVSCDSEANKAYKTYQDVVDSTLDRYAHFTLLSTYRCCLLGTLEQDFHPKTNKMSVMEVMRQRFEGIGSVLGVIHLLDGQRIITCSSNGSLRVWNLKNGKQIGEDWRDGDGDVRSIALSPDGKKVVSGGWDGAVRLWDIDTGKVIAKWTGHTQRVLSVCWSQDGRRVLSGSWDGTVRQWDVESGETISILEPIVTGHTHVCAVVYSPDMTLVATGGCDGPWAFKQPVKSSVQIWDAKTGELVATLQGHTWTVACLAWTKDGKMLMSGSYDCTIRTWNTTNWEQIAVLFRHTNFVHAVAISPNGRILASASEDRTLQLWNLKHGHPISFVHLGHSFPVSSVSFSADGKLLATGCHDANAYTWDFDAIVERTGFPDSTAKKLALHWHPDATRRSPAYRLLHGFFSRVLPGRSHSSAQPGSTSLTHSLHRDHDTSLFSPLDWARNLFKPRRPVIVEVPVCYGVPRNKRIFAPVGMPHEP
jgi:WD40 repeat protein